MFKCKHCGQEIEKDIIRYYRKQENGLIKDLQEKNKHLRKQLAIYHSNQKKYGWYMRNAK